MSINRLKIILFFAFFIFGVTIGSDCYADGDFTKVPYVCGYADNNLTDQVYGDLGNQKKFHQVSRTVDNNSYRYFSNGLNYPRFKLGYWGDNNLLFENTILQTKYIPACETALAADETAKDKTWVIQTIYGFDNGGSEDDVGKLGYYIYYIKKPNPGSKWEKTCVDDATSYAKCNVNINVCGANECHFKCTSKDPHITECG